jgi:C4-dicarboxylate transporter DctM subunit
MLIIGAAQVISWMLAYQNIPQQLADAMLAATRNPLVFLLLVNVLLLLVGTFMENGPALVMLAPVLYPIANKLGIDPYHFSMIVSLNLVLGLITPPVAICLSIGGLIAGVPSRVVTREVTPFFIMAMIVLLLITYVPQLSLWLPHLLNGK